MRNRASRTRTAALGVGLLLGFAPLAAQSAARDPWSRVPAPPTTCYSGDDSLEPLGKAIEAVNADLERQTGLNAEFKDQWDKLDLGEKQQRMVAFMQKNPQQAEQVLRAMSAAGSGAVSSPPNAAALLQEFEELRTKFHPAAASVRNPIQARIRHLIETKSVASGEAGFKFPVAADESQYQALLVQLDTEYEKVCHAWFGPEGTMTDWLRRYKAYLMDQVIPSREEQDRSLQVLISALVAPPSETYRSTAALEAVRDYMGKMDVAYRLRLVTAR